MEHPYATCRKVMRNALSGLRMRGALGAPDRSRILMFHDLVADGAPLPDEYACSFSDFCRILEDCRENGFSFIPLDALLDANARDVRRKKCVLTFDDGYESLAALAEPYLRKLGIPFTAYITSGWIGTPGYLSADALIRLADHPLCTIGSHTVTHPMTRFLPAEAVRRELVDSRAAIGRITGKPVAHLAFPFGSAYACSLRDARIAAGCGYKSAALTTPTAYARPLLYPRYRLPRLNAPQYFADKQHPCAP